MISCISCGHEIKTELTDGDVACDNCGTTLVIKQGKAYSMNEAEHEHESTTVDRVALLERLKDLTKQQKQVLKEKKEIMDHYKDVLSDLQAEINDVMELLEEKK